MHKKGISPIIAAIILIAIVVAVGALVANFIRSYVNTQKSGIDAQQTGIKCATDVNIKVLDVNGLKGQCTEAAPGTAIVRIQNAGVALQALSLAVVGENAVDTADTVTTTDGYPIAQGTVSELTAAVTLTGNFKQIVITPSIRVEGQEALVVCGESGIEIVDSDINSTCTS